MDFSVKVKFLFDESEVIVRIILAPADEQNCLQWVTPQAELNEIAEIQANVLRKITEASLDISAHNAESALRFSQLSSKVEKYPTIVKGIFDDLAAIHKSVVRMKNKLGLPRYKPTAD